MADEEWGLGWARSLGVMLNGLTIGDLDEHGERVTDETFLLMLNCHHQPIGFKLPPGPRQRDWNILIDTNEPDMPMGNDIVAAGEMIELVPLSLVLACENTPPAVSQI
jgi:glycogen operon protein